MVVLSKVEIQHNFLNSQFEISKVEIHHNFLNSQFEMTPSVLPQSQIELNLADFQIKAIPVLEEENTNICLK